jgi:hypothetical protein
MIDAPSKTGAPSGKLPQFAGGPIVQKVVVVAALGFLVVMVVRGGVKLAQRGGWWNPRIACDAPVVELGRIEADQLAPCRFELHNRGRQPLRIERIRVGCATCLKVLHSPRDPIPPAGTGTIVAELHPRGLDGPVIRTLAVHSNDPTQPVLILTIRADVESAAPALPERRADPAAFLRAGGGGVKPL